jgi:hypothetical protein
MGELWLCVPVLETSARDGAGNFLISDDVRRASCVNWDRRSVAIGTPAPAPKNDIGSVVPSTSSDRAAARVAGGKLPALVRFLDRPLQRAKG